MNFTLQENVNDFEHTSKSDVSIEKPNLAAINAILAYSKALEVKNSDLLKKLVHINLN